MKYKLLLIFAILIFSLSFICSADDKNQTLLEEQATQCINDSINTMAQMQSQNFSIKRLNDTFQQADDLYNAQLVLKERRRSYDFSTVIPYCDDIKKMNDDASTARDDLTALKKFYNESTKGLNTSTIDPIITEANQEMQNERYELVSPLVDKAYQEIVNVQASSTTFSLFYEATTRGIKQFFIKHWIFITIFVIVCLVLFLIYKTTILKWLTKRKIASLELRKKTLKGILMETQRDYFTYGKISEGTFNIRTKKLAEMVRDIDRQIPLLQEELAKLSRNKKENPSVAEEMSALKKKNRK